MKVFFDTNVYVAEALLGAAAEEMLAATVQASWRIYASSYQLDELERVLTKQLGFPRRLAQLSRGRIIRRTSMVDPGASHHAVSADVGDTPILAATMAAGVDYLVTNDRHLLALDPYEGVRIVSLAEYYQVLMNEGLTQPGA
ncbi:MAG TPA: PIN domain-containing protein [Gemmataceae bacterium]|nr:PIN domain-containing protein [Gemmataceae bacterium]